VAADRTNAIDVERELRLLAGSLVVPAADLVDAVMARVVAEPPPARRPRFATAAGAAGAWIRTRWRATALVVLGAVVAVGAATPVGAAVARWFTFGGVEVVHTPVPPPSTSVAVATSSAAPGLSLSAAAGRVGFTPHVPAGLPAPDTITVSPDDRVMSMTWSASGLRLDQFLGRPSPLFVKKSYQDIEFVEVGDDQGLWFDGPHELVYLDPDGSERRETARTAGRTLLWIDGSVTLRLEGAGSLDRALDIARTVR